MQVTFLCEQWPAYGVGFPDGRMVSFQHGELTLDRPEDIAVLRRHPLYGVRIFEAAPEGPSDTLLVDASDREAPASPGDQAVPLPETMVRLDGQKILCPECGPDVSPDFPTPAARDAHRLRVHGVTLAPMPGAIPTPQPKPRRKKMMAPAARLSKMR